jgi:ATP-dependent DNA helicase RecG
MKAESQNIEWKETWRDEYLKWICGFANAQGGKIYIGINDKGAVVGLPDAKKLLEDIPNKAKNHLGILVDVNLKTKAKKSCLEIIVEPYPNPISYAGEYHFRAGTTKQTLRGVALDKFLLKKQGQRWDGVPLHKAKLSELNSTTITHFKQKASQTGRMNADALKLKNELLIDNLRLKSDDNQLKRAAVLLFHKDPEKYITGAYIKIGYFYDDDDLAFQDEIHGNLFEQAEQTIQLLTTKYLKATISYQGLHRIEQFPIPEPALREALLNAIVHKDYSCGIPIQISVYQQKLIIWNQGQLPENWTIAHLSEKHPSKPYNPDIANCFFRAGLIESWGLGTLKILNECKKAKLSVPNFNFQDSDFTVTFKLKNTKQLQSPVAIKLSGTNADKVLQLIESNVKITINELAIKLKVSESTIERILKNLQLKNIIYRDGSKKEGAWIINASKE